MNSLKQLGEPVLTTGSPNSTTLITHVPAEGSVDHSITDVGNSQRFVRQHGDALRYSFYRNCWLVFDGQRWKRDDQRFVMELAKNTAQSIYKEAFDCPDGNQRTTLGKHALSTASLGKLQAMVALAKTDPKMVISDATLDADPMLLNVANGTLDLKSGQPREHRSADLLTKLTPIEYDANAQCPRWTQFVHEITDGDESLQRYLAQLAGYCLSGSTNEQAFFLMVGGGANGKSVFLHVLRKLLGEYASTTDFKTFSARGNGAIRNDLAKLQGNRLALCSELEAGERLAEAVVKQLTGGDEISVRKLYGEFFEYAPQFKILLATNHLPLIVGTGEGIWRRIQAIPFRVTFSRDQQDPDLTEKLLAELPGILNWAIEGCLSWQKAGRLEVPDAVLYASQAYREEMDSAHGFIVDNCVKEPAAKIGAGDLFETYRSWCDTMGTEPMNRKLFGTRLSEGGLMPRKNGKGNIDRIGIRLKTAEEKAAENAAVDAAPVAEAVAVKADDPVTPVEDSEFDPFADCGY